MLTLKSVSKKFKSNIVLKNLDLSVSKGEIIYIHGTNGCGKSTLLKLIAGILEPDTGTIKLEPNTSIGALIENPGFLENESLKNNLKFLATLKSKHNYNEDYIKYLCKNFSLNFDDKSKIKTYSVGMRQKVGIIQAIMEDQDLILLDEPSRGLDETSLSFFSKLIVDLLSKDKSIIIASHDKLNIPYSSVYFLNDGELIKE